MSSVIFFRVTNFTLNIYIIFIHSSSLLLFSTDNFHVTLSSQCIGSRFRKTVPLLSVHHHMCAFRFVHETAIKVWFEQEIWHTSWFFPRFFPSKSDKDSTDSDEMVLASTETTTQRKFRQKNRRDLLNIRVLRVQKKVGPVGCYAFFLKFASVWSSLCGKQNS